MKGATFMSQPLSGFQKKYLRGLAHGLKPVVLIGREGLGEGVIRAVDQGLQQHELIKVKFHEYKEKEQKGPLADDLATRTQSERVGLIGHTLILFRRQPDPEKRKIAVPERPPKGSPR
jgi:RNA-binding protein